MSSQTELDQSLKPLLRLLERYMNAHRFLWLLSIVCFLIAWNRGIDLLYGLLCLVIALQAVSWLLPWLSVRGISVSRQQLGGAQAGGALRLLYTLHAKRPRYHIGIADDLPCCASDETTRHFLPSIGRESRFEALVSCERRGAFTVEDIALSSGWPFGFVELTVRRPTPPTLLVVKPRTYPIRRLPLLRSNLTALDGYHPTSHSNTQHEFAGVREYRYGDSLKHIHWAASARHQELIVREYESYDRPHFLVIVDASANSDIGEAPESSFEYAVSIAASLIEYAIEQQIGLHLIIDCQHAVKFTLAPGAKNSHDYLERLAWVQADSPRPFSEVVHHALAEFADVNTLITLRNTHSELNLPALTSGHLDIQLQERSFLFPFQPYQEGWVNHAENKKTLYIKCGSELATLFNV